MEKDKLMQKIRKRREIVHTVLMEMKTYLKEVDWMKIMDNLQGNEKILTVMDETKEIWENRDLLCENDWEQRLKQIQDDHCTLPELEDLENLKTILTSLKPLVKEAKIAYFNSSSNTGTPCTSSMIASSPMDRAGVSNSSIVNEELLTLFQSTPCQSKILNISSSITLKMDGKPYTYKSVTKSTPNFFVDCKIYDLTQIPPNVLETQEMWKYATWRTKYYGNSLMHMKVNQMCQNLMKEIAHELKGDKLEEPKAKRLKNK